MGFSIHFDTISKELPIVHFKGSNEEFFKCYVIVYFVSLNVVLILANNVDPDEMQHYAAFHLGLHCLRKYPFRGRPVHEGLNEQAL